MLSLASEGVLLHLFPPLRKPVWDFPFNSVRTSLFETSPRRRGVNQGTEPCTMDQEACVWREDQTAKNHGVAWITQYAQ